jgi:hypothetical protein
MAKPLNFLIFNQGPINNLETPGGFTQERVVLPMAGEIVEVWANARNADVDVATTVNVWINNADSGIDLTVPLQTNPSSTPNPLASDGRIFVNAGDSVRLETNGECNNANTDTEFTLVLKARERWDRANIYLVGGENTAIHFSPQPNERTISVPVRSELFGVFMAVRTNAIDAAGLSFDIQKNDSDSGINPGETVSLISNGETGPAAQGDFTYCFRRA